MASCNNTMTATTHPTPQELGLSSKFTEWRPGQLGIMDFLDDGDSRFMGVAAPTGSGKSAAYIGHLLENELRGAVLTTTRALQTQNQVDFECNGLVDIRGKDNYQCTEWPGMSCKEARGVCDRAGTPDCAYGNYLHQARNSKLVSPNYQYWLRLGASGLSVTDKNLGEVVNPFQTLVLDESDLAEAELARFMSFSTTKDDIKDFGLEKWPTINRDGNTEIADWVEWAKQVVPTLNWHVDEIEQQLVDSKLTRTQRKQLLGRQGRAEGLVEGLGTLCREWRRADWVVDPSPRRVSVEFAPVWPGIYAERYLFCGIPKVILVSATLKPHDLGTLCIPKGDREFKEFPPVFNQARCPIYWIKTSPRMSHKSSRGDFDDWIDLQAQVVNSRKDRKGIIHTVSHARAKEIYDGFPWGLKDLLLFKPDLTTEQVVEEFKASKVPRVLLSPGVGTGFDFPYKLAEYQIVPKLPFPDMTSKVLTKKREKSPGVIGQIAARSLAQMFGRAMRAEDDKCETFIVDGNWGWFWKQNEQLFPMGTRVRWMDVVPESPTRLK